ncbi:PAS domain S-box protein [Pseudoroseomonas globiformis]|uniref:histidine kinase n=1 Tax=Teichococcus globiformis TaxID=2307229 RepID=A0ABV7FWT3_9PROT
MSAPDWTEADRLEALDRYGVLDTPTERDFDDLVRMAAELLEAPVAAVNLIAADRQWFKAERGIGVREMPLDDAICARLLRAEGKLVIPDLRNDPRFTDHPLVTGGPRFRFYAGELLRTPGGLPLGTLCVLDTQPRPEGLTERQSFGLKALARQVMAQLELHRALAEQRSAAMAIEKSETHYRTLIDAIETGFCIVEMRFDGSDRAIDYRIVEGNPAFERMTGLFGSKGKWVSEIAPDLERHWFDTYGRVALTGLPVRFENAAVSFGRWYDVQALRIGAPEEHQVAILFNDISDRRKAELTLARSEAHWRGLFERLEEGIILGELIRDDKGLVTDWRYLEVNPAWGRLMNIPPGSATGRTVRELLPDAADAWVADMSRLVATKQPMTFTHRVGGLHRWYEGRAHHVEGDRFAVVFIDVTGHIQAEAKRNALLVLGDRLQEAPDLEQMAYAASEIIGRTLGASRAGYGTMDAEGRVLTITQSWTRPGMADVAGQFDLCAFGDYVGDLQRGDTVAIADVEHDPRTAHRVEALSAVEARAMVNLPLMEQGRFVALFFVNNGVGRVWSEGELTFMRNVAERTRSAIERRRAEKALRNLAESLEEQVEEQTRDRNRMWRLSTDIMLVADFQARIEAVNPAWTTLLGWEADELVGRDFMSLLHPEDVEATLAEVGKLSDGQTTLRFENRYRQKDGHYRWLSWTAVPDERFIHAVGRDMQAEKEAAETLRRTEEALRQSQKMEAVGQLTGGLAHDFNNLLTGITGSLEILGIRLAQGRFKDADRYVLAAEGAAKRAATLTHRLLAFSRQQTLDPRPVDANRLVAGMEELIRRTVGPAITIEIVAAAGLWATLVDPNQLENALLNLAINARDAMPAGGRLTIETANTWIDHRSARDRDMAPGQYIAICVTDTGTGMPPEIAARAFEPFFTTKPIGQGTGLGLSMIYGFVRQSGGQVRIYSEVGQGTTMRLYLPRHLGAVEHQDEPPDLAEAPRAGPGETVLVVDDEPTIRMLVTEVLEELGYAAIEAVDGTTGLEVLRSASRIDLLVTDVGLPGGMSGRQMADLARLHRPGLKVLFITGYAENAVLGNGHMAPGMHVMTKPFAMEALASRIKELITGRTS